MQFFRRFKKKKKNYEDLKHSLWCSEFESIGAQLLNVSSNYHHHPFPFSLRYYDSAHTHIRITKHGGHLAKAYSATHLIATAVISMLKSLI